jgi:pimeloyl-ACP methyl ester carboxylesterase
MTERVIKQAGLELWTESFGQESDPFVLLIMGATAPALFWEEAFCWSLAERGLHVVRYDNRDCGLSSTSDAPYTLREMAADALSVMDAYDAEAAHIVGNSMGGGIAQYLALENRARVLTLTLLFSTPVLRELIMAASGQPTACELPMPDSPGLLALMQETALDPPVTREAQISFDLRRYGILAGSKYPFDEDHWRALLTRCHDRARDWSAGNNHYTAMATSDDDLRPRLRGLDVPTLVMHGTDDPAVPIAHGRALAEAIPGATFRPIEGFGHQFHPNVYPLWVEAISTHALSEQKSPV